MVIVVRNGSGVGCEPIVRNNLAGSSPVFHPNVHYNIMFIVNEHCIKVNNMPLWWNVYTAVLETALRNGMSARCRPEVLICPRDGTSSHSGLKNRGSGMGVQVQLLSGVQIFS